MLNLGEDVVMTTELQSSTATTSQPQKTAAETDQTINHVLPSVLGFVAFLLVVVIIVGCYLLHRGKKLCYCILHRHRGNNI